MNVKRILFWFSFVVILCLIVWGLIVAMNKPISVGPKLGDLSKVTEIDHVLGSTSTPVTLIEYGDFQCPACETYFPWVERLNKEASTTMHFVFRHYPLFPKPHKNAFIAAQASEAAGKQGKFWEMYRVLYENQTNWAESDTATTTFLGYAATLKLNISEYNKDFDSQEIKDKIQANHDTGERVGINSTPTFFVNGKAIVNPANYDAFKTIIDTAASESSK
jgi:protein-disulfide isomerase